VSGEKKEWSCVNKWWEKKRRGRGKEGGDEKSDEVIKVRISGENGKEEERAEDNMTSRENGIL
jgi:hypothetical protein